MRYGKNGGQALAWHFDVVPISFSTPISGVDAMPKGTVKWFNTAKGYGFIQPQGGGGRDVFVHISAVERAGLTTLNEGQVVEFEIVENRGKSSAENLKVAK
jgi:CspA family cold shock protein